MGRGSNREAALRRAPRASPDRAGSRSKDLAHLGPSRVAVRSAACESSADDHRAGRRAPGGGPARALRPPVDRAAAEADRRGRRPRLGGAPRRGALPGRDRDRRRAAVARSADHAADAARSVAGQPPDRPRPRLLGRRRGGRRLPGDAGRQGRRRRRARARRLRGPAPAARAKAAGRAEAARRPCCPRPARSRSRACRRERSPAPASSRGRGGRGTSRPGSRSRTASAADAFSAIP